MSHDAFDKPSLARPVEGEVAVLGPGKTGLSLTPDAARRAAANLEAAAEAADAQKIIDLDDPDAAEVWAERLRVSVQAVRRVVLEVGPTVEAVSSRLKAIRDAAD